jgi:probable 2-oxoglutarate dehydrogenase E1 component DHKTD1
MIRLARDPHIVELITLVRTTRVLPSAWTTLASSTAPVMLRLHGAIPRALQRAAASSSSARAAARRFSSSSAPSIEALALRSMATAFRQYGHLEADIDPLGLRKPAPVADLAPAQFDALLQHSPASQAAYEQLRASYCGKIGFEFEHLSNASEKQWLADAAESLDAKFPVHPSDLRNAYTSMLMADVFETFMAKKFSSFKRYSGEGAEAMMPAVNTVLQAAAQSGVSDVVIGMPHRGRLALLVGLLEYPAHKLFHKVSGYSDFPAGVDGVDDVTSHLAQSVDKHYGDRKVHVSLLHNPSHLEIINPVTTGKVRAKMDSGANALGFMFHGDAAFSGQGCVPEGLSLSQLPSFTTNGSVHWIVNNQVGFTTTYRDGRSTRYASDIAKGIEAPVLHVNGESVHHVIQAARLAVAYRNQFHKDIVVDMIGYRRHGHNEVDEPRFTQPVMYDAVARAGRFPFKFSEQLQQTGLVTADGVQRLVDKFNTHLERELQKVTDGYTPSEIDAFQGKWKDMKQPTIQELYEQPASGVELDRLVQVGLESVKVPETVQVHDRLARSHIQARKTMLTKDDPSEIKVDWATAEAMAFGTLLQDGHGVRLAGQDCRRGTFSHRHAAFTDQSSEELYFPFKHMASSQANFNVVNSNLSELAVMAFEYGYSWEDPRNLVLWEAQFGDFFNGAQIVIDTFLSCGESKWMRQSGLTLLLPHGYDGAGPDHSSGRLERFLQLVDTPALDSVSTASHEACDWRNYQHNTNLIVVNLTTPANYFHLLRRQQLRAFRKPVVAMGPKTLLRLADATSSLEELGPESTFQPVYTDASIAKPSKVKRVLFCSGKFYYDLVRERSKRMGDKEAQETAIVRIEELAPFPFQQVADELDKFDHAKKIVWIQEEPLNQGAWLYARPHLEKIVAKKALPVEYIGRESLAACAVGLSKRNAQQSQAIFEQAFGSV